MEHLLENVAPADHDLVRSNAAWLTEAARHRAAPGEADRSARVYQTLPATVAAIAPALDRDRLLLAVEYGLWTIARLDDDLDDPAATRPELQSLAARVRGITTGSTRPDPRDPFGTELASLWGRLQAYDTGGVARLVGSALYEATLAGIAQAAHSRRVALGDPAPTVENYLRVAGPAMNYRSFAWTLVLLAGDVAPAPVLSRWSRAMTSASVAVRLANDLASADRDRSEGRLNVLDLRDRAGEPMTADRTTRAITHRARRHLAALASTQAEAPPPTLQILQACLRTSLTLYRVGDLR
ncbi:hypothetical protein AB0M43_38170 [Longispora sp. NPDC051575]|uniref:terpene synthase family protein n=1 Tax=Longispora sp. NPDC051575 TaxID=3154943 RepID=UPI00341618A5